MSTTKTTTEKVSELVKLGILTPREIELNGRVIHTEFVYENGTTLCYSEIKALYRNTIVI